MLRLMASTRLSVDDHSQVDSCSRADTSHLRVKGAKGYQSANVLSRIFWLYVCNFRSFRVVSLGMDFKHRQVRRVAHLNALYYR